MINGLNFGRRVVFEDYLQQEFPRPARSVRRSLQNSPVVKVIIKLFTLVSTFIFAVATLGTFTLAGSFILHRRIRKLQPQQEAVVQQKYVWVKPLIQQTEKDLDNIEGEYLKTEEVRDEQGRRILERGRPKKAATTEAARVLFDKKTMVDVVGAVFDWAFKDLMENPKYETVLNESASIFLTISDRNPERYYQSNMDALSHWMILFLIKNGGLETSCDKTLRWLVLNENLRIAPSGACHVLASDGLTRQMFYQFEDAWTPSEDSDVSEGIDPITLKWIIERLSGDRRAFSYLEALLLDALIPEDNAVLRKAKQFIDRNTPSARLVKRALALVNQMTKVLKTNFAEILERKWREKAVSRDGHLLPAPPKQVRYPKFTTKFPWLEKPSVLKKLGRIALEALKVLGFILGNLLSLGMLSFATTVYLHEKLNKLQVQNNRNNLPRRPMQQKEMWIKSPYEKRADDPDEIPVKVERLNQMTSPKEISQVDKMDEIISFSFDDAFETLFEISQEKVWDVHFNRSSKIFNETVQVAGTHSYKYQDNMNSLYRFMVFNLIEAGGLTFEEGGHRVSFNDHLSVGYSFPCRVPSRDGQSQVTFFLNRDDWTPSQNDNIDCLNGVDPVSVKWILERLKTDETALNHLKVLLLNGLIPNESDHLIQAKYYLVDGGEKGELVKAAYDQISTIALVIAKKFSTEILDRWDALANDDSCDPLEKEGDFVLDPNGIEQEWMPPAYLPNDFLVEEIIKTKSLIGPIWKNIDDLKMEVFDDDETDNRNLPENRVEALGLLSKQYYWIHAGIQAHGCLMSALTTHLHQGSDSSNHNFDPAAIKYAMAEYLNQQPNDFRAEIAQSTSSRLEEGWSVEEYRNWLLTGESPRNKRPRNNQDMGDLEMELFSRTFHIQLAVFEMGRPYLSIDGRMVPGRTFGPNTTEKFVLLNAPGFTFYALMPKCRSVHGRDTEDVKESLRHIRDFWGGNNGKEYGERIQAAPRAQPSAL